MSSVARADLRFVLASPVRSAVVLGDLAPWTEALAFAGVQVDDRARRPDVAVAPVGLARSALATGAPTIVLEGRAFHRLSRAGFAVRRYLPLPSIEAPGLILPTGDAAPVRYALRRWRPASTAAKRVRNRIAEAAISSRALPPVRPLQAVGTRGPTAYPYFVAAATEVGVPSDVSWYLAPGHGDALTRGTFYLFRPASREPDWVLKFARIPGYRKPFDRDEQGLRLAAAAGETVVAHVPRLFGRLEVDGVHASVETAASGEPLSALVRRSPGDARRKIDEIADWVVRVGVDTASPADALRAERERLTDEILPQWTRSGADPAWVDRLAPVPGVLQHNDLGTWNLVVDAAGFTAIDWEWAREHGFPLWDLLYFLVDALPQLDGARTDTERVQAALKLVRGESRSSGLLFSWLGRAVSDIGIPAAAVGTLATLCFLHHGRSHLSRARELSSAGATRSRVPPIEQIAPLWLADPALGPTWSAWRR
ncbi:MAG TPA: hypothetical protein VH816_18785 [Gaiellaceae bacterium]|jgi:hypothetical protein